MIQPVPAAAQQGATTDKLVRHALVDRVFHWAMAVSVLVLLGTGFLPILGVEFPWVTIHWVSGLVLTVAVLFHTVRALFWQDLKSMWIDGTDLKNLMVLAGWNLRLSRTPPGKPGKYSLAQKLIHGVIAAVIMVVVVTGLPMMVRIDTPLWERDPYWLEDTTWGLIYVLHDLTALCLITLVMAHVYFALRPEKLFFTRSMLLGWITRREYLNHHDPGRWKEPRELEP